MARFGVVLLVAVLGAGAAAPAVSRAGGAPPSGSCAAYEAVDLGAADGWPGSASARGVNDAGVVVGSVRPDGEQEVAFTWSRTRGARTIEVPGAVASTARDVNDRGLVVGTASYPDGGTRPFVWDPRSGRTTDLGTLGGWLRRTPRS